MINNDLWEYQNWLMGIVVDKEHSNYYKLLDCLFSIEFTWPVNNGDENRAADGIHLRTVFEDQKDLPWKILNDNFPCTVLEMMVALAVRCSEDILWDGVNNYTPYLFWTMIDNLKLSSCHDSNFDEHYVEERIRIFLNRTYDENGVGGLFLSKKNPKNFENVEIWYQAQNWILENFM